MWVSLLATLALGHEYTGGEAPAVNAQLYRPPIDAESTLWTDDAGLAEPGTFGAGVHFSYVNRPIRYVFDEGDAAGEEITFLRDALQSNVTAHATFWRLRVGADVPVYLATASDLASGAGFGDVAMDVKGTLFDPEEAPFGLALGARTRLPSTTVDLPVGDGQFGWALQAIVDRSFGNLRLAANLGTRSQPRVSLENAEMGDQYFLRTGAGYALPHGGVSLDVAAHGTYAGWDANTTPVEAMLGGWMPVGRGLVVRGGAGMGLTGAIGAPRARGVLSLSYQPRQEEPVPFPVVRHDFEEAPAEPVPEPEVIEPRIREGTLQLAVVDEAGDPIDAVVELEDVEDSVLLAGGEGVFERPEGSVAGRVSAEGYVPQDLEQEIVADEVHEVVVTLASARVHVEHERIDIDERVHFDTNRATLRPESHDILDEVVDVLEQRPDLTRVRIEGHTDSRGDADYNQHLSERRAAAVKSYLVEQGIDPDRLESAGFGLTRPLDIREVPEAWERNRRVEFVIREQHMADGEPDQAATSSDAE